MLVRLGVRLVAHRLRAPARREDPELGQLGECGVDGAATELGDDRRRASVDLVGGQMLGRAVGERAEDRASLRGDAQPARAQELPRIRSERHHDMFAHPRLAVTMQQDTVLPRRHYMILRIDRLQTELPPPSDPDPAGAAVVQELLGGKFGEMSTFMNYTFQSFNFRDRQGARPFYDLVANIAAEEFGHIELVSAAINTMLTGAGEKGALPEAARTLLNPQHFVAGGAGTLVQDSNGKPWNGDYVTSTGDLVEDLTHNFFLETGARNGKLKVYEMVDHPAARALTGYLLVRGGVHQVAYARAVENLTGADLLEAVPVAAHPDRQDPRVPAAHQAGRAHQALPLLTERLPGARGGLQRHASGDRRRARRRRRAAEGVPPYDLPAQEGVFAPDYEPEEIAEIARKLRKAAGLSDDGHRGQHGNGVVGKIKEAVS